MIATFPRLLGILFVSFIWFVWFISFLWFNRTSEINQTNETNQTNQINQKGREPQLRVSQSRGSRGVDAQSTKEVGNQEEVLVGYAPESCRHRVLRRESSPVSLKRDPDDDG